MTADPRAEAEKIIRDALERWVDTSASYYAAGFYSTDADNATDAILDALEADGWSLLPPGGQSEIHWAVIGEDDSGEWIEYEDDEAEARRRLARILAAAPDSNARVVFRTEHTSPWQPSDTPGEPA